MIDWSIYSYKWTWLTMLYLWYLWSTVDCRCQSYSNVVLFNAPHLNHLQGLVLGRIQWLPILTGQNLSGRQCVGTNLWANKNICYFFFKSFELIPPACHSIWLSRFQSSLATFQFYLQCDHLKRRRMGVSIHFVPHCHYNLTRIHICVSLLFCS